MKRVKKSSLISLALIVVVCAMVLVSTALADISDQYAANVNITQDSTIKYNGQDTVIVDFRVKTGTGTIKNLQKINVIYDTSVFELISPDGTTSFEDALETTPTELDGTLAAKNYADAVNTVYDKWTSSVLGNVNASKTVAYLSLQPSYGKTPLTLAELTSIESIRLGLTAGKTFADITSSSIRIALLTDIPTMNQSNIAALTDGTDNYVYGATIPAAGDYALAKPTLTWGWQPTKPKLSKPGSSLTMDIVNGGFSVKLMDSSNAADTVSKYQIMLYSASGTALSGWLDVDKTAKTYHFDVGTGSNQVSGGQNYSVCCKAIAATDSGFADSFEISTSQITAAYAPLVATNNTITDTWEVGDTPSLSLATLAAVSGGSGSYSYAVKEGSTLPAGLILDTTTGALSGALTTANASTAAVTFTVTDAVATVGNIKSTTKDVVITFPAIGKGDSTFTWVAAAAEGKTVYGPFTYSPDSAVSAPTAANYTKTGSTNAASFTYYTAYTDATTNTLTTTANSGAATDGGAPKNAGDYYVVATVAMDDNYNGVTSDAHAFTIQGLPTTFTWVVGANSFGTGLSYTGAAVSDPALTTHYTVTGTDREVTFRYYTTYTDATTNTPTSADLGGAASEGSAPKNAGSYWVVATVAAAGNYDAVTSAAHLFMIGRGAGELVISQANYDYNGTVAAPTVTKNTNGTTPVYTYYTNATCTTQTSTTADGAASEGGVPTYAGSYWVKGTVAQAGNYNAATSDAVAFTINKIAPPNLNTVTYNVKSNLGGATDNVAYSFDLSELIKNKDGFVSPTYATTGFDNPPPYLLHTPDSDHSVFPAVTGTTLSLTATRQPAGITSTVQIKITSRNYTDATADVIIKAMDKKTATVSVSLADWTYNGTAATPSYSVSFAPDTHTEDTATGWTFLYTGTVNGGTADGYSSAAKPDQAGSYTLTATYEDEDYYGTKSDTFTINRAAITPTVTCTGFTYNGSAATATVSGNTGSGAESFTYYTDAACTTQTTAEGSGAASDGAAPKNAGNYWVKATVAQTNNYQGTTSAATAFTISPAATSFTWVAAAAGGKTVYGANAQYTGSAIADPTATNYTVTGSTGTVSFKYYTAYTDATTNTLTTTANSGAAGNGAAPKNAGSYYVVATVDASNNYEAVTSAAHPFTIGKADSTFTWNTAAPQYAAAVDYTGSAVADPLATHYTKTGSTGAVSFIYYTAYTDTTKTLTTTANSGAASDGAAPVNAGTYYVVAIVAADPNNYALESAPRAFTINKINYTGTKTASTTVVQNQAGAKTYSIADLLTNIAGWNLGYFVYQDNTDGLLTTPGPSGIGSTIHYSVAAKAAGVSGKIKVTVTSTNYNPFDILITVTTVAKTEVDIKGATLTGSTSGDGAAATPYLYTYTGSAQGSRSATTPTAYVKGTSTVQPITGSYTYTYYTAAGASLGATAPTDAGSYYLEAALNDTAYTGSQKVYFTIQPKPVTLNWSSATYTYTGGAQTITATYTDVNSATKSAAVAVLGTSGLALNDTTFLDSGDYTATASISDTNYTLSSGTETKTYTMNQKSLSGATVVLNPTIMTYTGAQVQPAVTSVTPSGFSSGIASSNYTVGYGANINAGTNAGSVTVTAAANTNYTGSATVNFNITKATITVSSVTIDPKVYDNTTAIAATAVHPSFSKPLTYGTDYTITNASYTGADAALVGNNKATTFTVNLTASAMASNFQFANGTNSITITTATANITKATPVISLSNLSQTVKSAGDVTPVTATLKPADPTATVRIEYNVGGNWVTTLPTDFGTYQVRATLAAATNNLNVPADYTTGSLTITKQNTTHENRKPGLDNTLTKAADSKGSALLSAKDLDGITELTVTAKVNSQTVTMILGKGLLNTLDVSKSLEIVITPVTGVSSSYNGQMLFTASVEVFVDGKQVKNFGSSTYTLILPYAPTASMDTDKLIMLYVDDSNIATKVAGSYYSSAYKGVVAQLNHTSYFAVAYDVQNLGNITFNDVSRNRWSAPYIYYLAERGIVSGVGGNFFNPTANVTRAEFVKMLAGVAGADLSKYAYDGRFSDVNSSVWYATYVAWAAETGVTAGVGNDKFAPNASITRQEMAAMIYRFTQESKFTLPQTEKAITFADVAQFAPYAQEAISAMQQAGIISGVGENKFAPTNNATREETAKMLAVTHQLLNK